MSVLILVIALGLAITFEIWALMRNHHTEGVEERRSRRALLAELARIEAHSPDHVVDGGET